MPLDTKEPLALAEGFSLCESLNASALSPWHLRRLTQVGAKYGGGIDTQFLCKRRYLNGWDLQVPITEHHLYNSVCEKCADEFTIQTGYKLLEEEEI